MSNIELSDVVDVAIRNKGMGAVIGTLIQMYLDEIDGQIKDWEDAKQELSIKRDIELKAVDKDSVLFGEDISKIMQSYAPSFVGIDNQVEVLKEVRKEAQDFVDNGYKIPRTGKRTYSGALNKNEVYQIGTFEVHYNEEKDEWVFHDTDSGKIFSEFNVVGDRNYPITWPMHLCQWINEELQTNIYSKEDVKVLKD